jgi:iron only hydrogenase large subunit-like protein
VKSVIQNDLNKCIGCNRCVRNCPIDEANVTNGTPGNLKVTVDSRKCIACGSCLKACHHGSRYYTDDTERFFEDLQRGVSISLIAAPAAKSNISEWGRLFAWLKRLGVTKIYDVSLGADICTWAHIRYLQKNGLKPLITQPCPVIVNYILMHRNELLQYLSPVHSPMLCTAVFMRKYEGVRTKMAALSPCVAKTHEFEGTHRIVDYNVTLQNLLSYIEANRVEFPVQPAGFDHYEAGLGSLYPMPGGLKENVEHYLGKSMRIDKSEGTGTVYHALDEYAKKPLSKLPIIFDVLNCAEGCNMGTGCPDGKDIFDIGTSMNDLRQEALNGHAHRPTVSSEMKASKTGYSDSLDNNDDNRLHYLDALYKKFDNELKVSDFIRQYTAAPVRSIAVTPAGIEEAFVALGKMDETSRRFDCGACGNDSCRQMAVQIAKGINLPINCIQKTHEDALRNNQSANNALKSLDHLLSDTAHIKQMTDEITSNINSITEAVAAYNASIKDIEKISLQVNLISINASIEAARAGVYGKAFGVVAEEIRRLAKITDNSAKKTQNASAKANEAISAVTDKISEIGASINASYTNVSSLAETRKNSV